MNIIPYLDYKLCYVDDIADSECYYELCFTSNMEGQWGDDWNDRPAFCNAERPYEDENHDIFAIVMSCSWNTFIFGGKTYSVEDMNNHKAAWLVSKEEDNTMIEGGDTLLEVINKIKNIKDANIYVKYRGDED